MDLPNCILISSPGRLGKNSTCATCTPISKKAVCTLVYMYITMDNIRIHAYKFYISIQIHETE